MRGLCRAHLPDRDRHLPASRRQAVYLTVAGKGPRRHDRKALLPQRHALVVTAAVRFGDDQRHAILFGEGSGDGGDRLAGRALKRLPEIGGGGVVIGMRGHIAADAVAKRALTEIVFQHADEGLALVVGDAVERGHGFALISDRLLDRMRGAARIERHGVLLLRVAVEPGLPLRIEMRGRLLLHPAGKTLVEPEIVPPAHGDEIAEPLMRHLMCDDAEDTAPGAIRIARGIEQQPALEKGDAAPILHRAAKAAGHRDQVKLRQRIFHAEIVVVISEQLDGVFQREASVLAFACGRHHADRGAVGVSRDPLQFAGRKHEQIARHLRCRREHHPLQIVGRLILLHHRHVTDRKEGFRHHYGQRERRLERGLIPARENPPRVGGLELARNHPLGALPGRVVGIKQPASKRIDLRRKNDAQAMRARGKRLGKGQRRGLSGGVERDFRALRVVVDAGRRERHVDRVQRHLRGRLAHLDVDGFSPRKRELLQIGGELDRIVNGDHGLRQLARRRVEGKPRLGERRAGSPQHEREGRDEHRGEIAQLESLFLWARGGHRLGLHSLFRRPRLSQKSVAGETPNAITFTRLPRRPSRAP